ncbi:MULTISPECIES: EamA family transporter [Tenebrionibacter/Tenebrionicola group]|jgi:carboxylate/amino acid/amine transporter|uniref:EamA family transporter n=2 Tax=Tenebrionibacter/Tenebrionicola group TaxID=2969848 RepID=A0A8K0V2V4_9ENTR|nr:MULTISPECIES: EamA family transporter [Tenebrionibacter/Tenebrionicola group]MBK4714155.1 EamA family transporter [Tenebrionibacter intestinalis]MBV4411981.1 EamA family transporter [Tenebrionicola larvae]MBV5094841.1 EamA family transporter [Tenebrionicola larvae]
MGQTKKGILFVLLAAVLWGSSGVAAQYIMENSRASAQWLTMVRLLFSGLILLTLSFMQGERVFRIFTAWRDIRRLLLFTFFGALLVQLTFLLTIQNSNAATATVLQFLSPSIIVAWFALVRKKRAGPFVFAAIMTSLAGTFLLVTHANPTSLTISGAALFWGIASAFCAAFYTTYSSGLIACYGTLPVVGWSMLLGGLTLTPFYGVSRIELVNSGSVLLAFFYLVVVGTAITFSLYLKGAQVIGGSRASILSCAEPLSSALLSLLLLGVTFTLPDWLGTLLIVFSVILIALDSRRRHVNGREGVPCVDGGAQD